MKKELKVKIDENVLIALAKKFSTGSQGYGAYGKIIIDGEKYQVSCNIIKIKSKFVIEKVKGG